MENKLSKTAYGGIKGSQYTPYITKQRKLKELTPLVIIIGVILAALFAASNTYAALTAGMTVAAGIPGAILGGGLLQILSKKSNALNTNLVQGMASGGESMASGITFVLPALFLIGTDVKFIPGVLVGVVGALLGISITSAVYNYLIVKEHGTLSYPEGMAISETVVSTDAKGEGLKIMGLGAGLGAVISALSISIFGFISSTFSISGGNYKYQWSTDANPMLVGIGFIVGMEVAVAMFAGSVLANFAIIPLIGYFTSMADPAQVTWNTIGTSGEVALNTLGAADIQSTFTKYIGAGMMLAGGIIGAIKLIPVIISSLKETMAANSNSESSSKVTGIVFISAIILLLISTFVITNSFLMIIVTFILVLLFSFLFSVVAARMTGNIGTSNLPVSGMTIASLLMVTVTFVVFGLITNQEIWTNEAGNITLLLALTVVVSAISSAGGYAQTQKVSFVIGGNKDIVQKMYVLATTVGVVVTVGVVIILKDAILSGAAPAPQATLMASITSGILAGNLPWAIIFVGMFMALVLLFLDLPIMTVALGFYLPMGTVTAILIGALVKYFIEKMNKKDQEQVDQKLEKGTIFSSGLIAGGAIMGLIGAFLAVFATNGDMATYFFFLGHTDDAGLHPMLEGNIFALILILVLGIITFFYINKKKAKK
ncbi:MAG: OPT family oligopeptide transporter [Mycoplasmatales bacterium]